MNIYLTHYNTISTTSTELIDEIDYPQRVHWLADTYANKDSGLIYAPHKIAEKVLHRETLKMLRDSAAKTAFILASGNSHFAGINPKTLTKSRLTYEYKFLPLTLTQVYAGRIAQSCGANDLVMTDASACASSLKVMTEVIHLIKLYNFDRVIVLSVEDAVSNSVLQFFGESGASLTLEQEQQGIKPSAFDSTNRGFYVGQGAVFAVFESEKIAKMPIAELMGAYCASEQSTNSIGQRDDGEGFVRATMGALTMANISENRIDVVKTHGTGTLSNNQSEGAALKKIFSHPFIATSYKQHIGHTMGASGLLETCLLISDIYEGKIPAIKNRTTKDNVFLSHDEDIDFKPTILSQAAGMGNIYASAIFDTNV
jgi:3-oxoacyl-(acyl-carrier-protein) synthase